MSDHPKDDFTGPEEELSGYVPEIEIDLESAEAPADDFEAEPSPMQEEAPLLDEPSETKLSSGEPLEPEAALSPSEPLEPEDREAELSSAELPEAEAEAELSPAEPPEPEDGEADAAGSPADAPYEASDENSYHYHFMPPMENAYGGDDALADDDEESLPEEPGRRRRTLFIVLTCVFFVLALAAAAGMSYVYLVIKPYESYDKIFPNVYCAGIDLGGMTRDEAQAAIEEALASPSYSVSVVLPDATYEFQPAQEGVTLNGALVAQMAYDYLRSDTSAFGMYKAYKKAKSTEYHLDAETELVYSTEDIQALAVEIYQETQIDPTESAATYDETTHTVSITLGTPGRKIEPQTIVDAVENAFDTMNFSDITLEYETTQIDVDFLTTLSQWCADSYDIPVTESTVYANEEAHTIDVTIGTPGYSIDTEALCDLAVANVENGTYGTVSLEQREILPADVDITEAYNTLACDPTEPYYASGDVQEGSNGYTLDWDYATSTISAAGWGETVSVAMTAVAPERTAEEIRAVLFRDQLSEYSSPHTANSGRTTNLKLACSAINGTVLNPGETFSFNGVVGERTAAKGYQSATVYVGTDSKEELGGGICQVASTIYDAVLYADLEVVTRAPHTFFVTYVPGGLDATVYWGSQDFCFRNDTDYPIRVDAWVSGGYVTIQIYGTKVNDNYVKLSSTKLATNNYSTVTEYSSAYPSGTSTETTYPYTGYTYEAYQYVYSGDGTLLETNYLGKSVYQKRDRVITIGTG